MKFSGAFLILVLCVLQTNFVQSGLILDRIKTGVADTRQGVRCGIHKIGGLLSHQDADCEMKHNEIDTTEKIDKKVDVGDRHSHATTPTVTASPTGKNSTFQGRRVIAVGANCPPGFRGDGKGNCREEY
ncbi:hypothetical protein TcasGA2_TC008277 [Tribolium castaneum]|uniref:Uncharacterized protein n=1 Tax=Tribolium castaneum TaxID=7070 RepID=D2A0V5_TRICA|nr:PREDICTED: uncharacterized protein LOC661094 [Tribolium castaneum]XP_976371.1 PREDICTED: uncharacterized protein LOC661094 [Tribolium castaneum]EFA02567.1 hypothetical protein TcasGA2_TC008277 [Tribolium castaneum]|eukprot:XP_015835006.1 PREDICTED: uncharacterized protein LOC661094 [Tribolium castaneum]